MAYWMREASIQIGPKKYGMNDLYFTFEVPFEDSTTLQSATFAVHNLSEATRNGIKRGHVVILNAGYGGDVGVIFVGQVSACSHQHQGTEWITKITATAAMDEWLSRKVSKTYTQKISAKEIVPDLLNIFGLEVSAFELAVNKVYERGRICSGKLKDVLIQIIVNECKSRLLIKNGTIVINDPSKGIKTGYVLTPESGLLATSDDVEETIIAVGVNSNKSSTQKGEAGNYITRECLLNYHIGPADEIKIQSRNLNGKFLVVRGKHVGNPTGQWKTVLEFKPL